MFKLMLVDANARAKVQSRAGVNDVPGRVLEDIRRAQLAFGGIPTILLWDHPNAKNARRAIYSGYKKKREQDPISEASVRLSLERLKAEYLCWYSEDYEADDMFAAIVQRYPDLPLIIYSNDKDLHPLLAGPTLKLQLRRAVGDVSQWQIETIATVEAAFGLKLEQLYEYQALAGDSVDSVPGVKDIGSGTALTILRHYPTVQEAVLNVEEIPIIPSRRKALVTGYRDGTFDTMLRLVRPLPMDSLPSKLQATVEQAASFVPVSLRNFRLSQVLSKEFPF